MINNDSRDITIETSLKRVRDYLINAPNLGFTFGQEVVVAALEYIRITLGDPNLELKQHTVLAPAPYPTRIIHEVGYKETIERPNFFQKLMHKKTRFVPIVRGINSGDMRELIPFSSDSRLVQACKEVYSLTQGNVKIS